MRFLVTIPASPESEAGVLPDERIIEEMSRFNEDMAKAGVLLAAEGLHDSSKGARIVYSGGTTRVIDGPFTESKEMIAGFFLIQVKSKEEAIEWMKRAPFGGGVVLELRQIFEMDDLRAALTPEQREQEERQSAQIEANARG